MKTILFTLIILFPLSLAAQNSDFDTQEKALELALQKQVMQSVSKDLQEALHKGFTGKSLKEREYEESCLEQPNSSKCKTYQEYKRGKIDTLVYFLNKLGEVNIKPAENFGSTNNAATAIEQAVTQHVLENLKQSN